MKKAFYFNLRALFIRRIFKFLYWLFRLEKVLDKKAKVNFKIYVIITLLSKQLQCKYCPTSQKVMTVRQWNLVSYWNITWEIVFFKIMQKMRHRD